jgi:hypothetical protein
VSPKNTAATTPYRFTGTIRDGAGVPIDNFPASQLELDFSNCLASSTRPFNQVPADQNSDPSGLVVWEANLDFGGGDPCEVQVLVQSVVYKTLAGHTGSWAGPENSGGPGQGCQPPPPGVGTIDGGVRSVDAQGDGIIGLQDLGALQAEFFNIGVRLDYVGDLAQAGGPPGVGFDGCTDLRDLGQLQDHFFAQ